MVRRFPIGLVAERPQPRGGVVYRPLCVQHNAAQRRP